MRHGHADGAPPEEILAFADSILNKRPALPKITEMTEGSVRYKAKRAVVKAELNYTKDSGRWQDRKWESVPAELNSKAHTAHADVPEGVKAWYINLIDDKGLVVSSEHRDR